jgi:basic amino acid/polyamine antiporter, APA family
MFAYLGLESATVPAGDVRDPERIIPSSTLLGIGIATTLYVLGTIVVMGIVPRDELVRSTAPFSEAARIMWGPWGQIVVATAVILSSIGALNGWALVMGQVPMAAARDGLFPPLFSRLSSRNVPAIGIVLSAVFATALVFLQAAEAEGLSAAYKLVVGLSTMAAVVPYAFCALAGSLVSARVFGSTRLPRVTMVEIVAFVFALFTLYGCGGEAVLYGTVLLMLGIPVYVWQRRRYAALDLSQGAVADCPGKLSKSMPIPGLSHSLSPSNCRAHGCLGSVSMTSGLIVPAETWQ